MMARRSPHFGQWQGRRDDMDRGEAVPGQFSSPKRCHYVADRRHQQLMRAIIIQMPHFYFPTQIFTWLSLLIIHNTRAAFRYTI